MRVLTVRQPWAWAIIHGGKTVENRTRNLAGAYRGPVAIHAGLTLDEPALGWVTNPAIWEGMLNAKGKPASKAAIRNAQLHALGNGVVPQQVIYALEVMLSWRVAASLGSTP